SSSPHHDLPSFPTRRSSDLAKPFVLNSSLPLQSSRVAAPRKCDTQCSPPARRTPSASSIAAWSMRRSTVVWAGKKKIGNVFSSRSEEHTSELQSRGHLVCRL